MLLSVSVVVGNGCGGRYAKIGDRGSAEGNCGGGGRYSFPTSAAVYPLSLSKSYTFDCLARLL